jgi:hypothetical protein
LNFLFERNDVRIWLSIKTQKYMEHVPEKKKERKIKVHAGGT